MKPTKFKNAEILLGVIQKKNSFDQESHHGVPSVICEERRQNPIVMY